MQSLTPKTLAELAQALSAATEKAKIIAGCTDFIIKERAGKFAPDLLIYPGFIPELNTVTKENGVLRIGAAVPMNGITAALKDDKAFCAIGGRGVRCRLAADPRQGYDGGQPLQRLARG